MIQLTNQEKLRPWMGFVVQAFFLVLFITAGAWMQRNWGIPGLVASELMYLVVSVGYCLIRRVKLSEMFPIKKITASDFFGVVFLGIAGFLFSMVALGISMAILPKSFRAEATGLSDFLGGMNYPILVLVAAVTPAICEEAMERGCVLSHFRSIKRDWVIVLIMGIFFGIMHMSPLRFLTTATLGAILSYLVVKKNNILLPVMLHFFNNFTSTTLSTLAGSISSTEQASDTIMEVSGLSILGAYLFIAFAAPIFLVLGMMLIDRENHKAYRFAIAGGVSVIMLFSGLGITMTAALAEFSSTKPIVDAEYTILADDEFAEDATDFNVKYTKTYTVSLEITGVSHNYIFVLSDASGKELIHMNCAPNASGKISFSQKLSLPQGTYHASVKALSDGSSGEDARVHLKVA